MTRHIHLDQVGGIAGDMFIAALLNAFPEHPEHMDGAIAAAEALAPVECMLLPHKDHALSGARFAVQEHATAHHPQHTHWSDIRVSIEASALTAPVKHHALGIFGGLAEAIVHGIITEHVAFHEAGAADSIADIVAAVWLIDALGPATWSVSPLPLGSGVIQTAQGRLPVPVPATALLLRGLPVVDDGVPGLTKSAKAAATGGTERYKISHHFDGTTQNPDWFG
jgi:uncharacterized protein (DUF111 family)